MSEASNKLPSAFKRTIQEQLGAEESQEFFQALEGDPQTSIRTNPYKWNADNPPGLPIPWATHGYFLKSRPSFTLDPLFHAGAYYVQESSSMFISHILESVNAPKGIYLDLCAAPGGKSTLLSSYLGNDGLLVANEVIKSRANILKENVIKWGLGNTVVTNNDPSHFEDLEGFFDLLVIDAPCSGEGMFRKDAQARNEWSPEHVEICAARQERILNATGALVAAGGYLLYSTCTFNEKENEENLRYLTEEFAFEPVRISIQPEWGIVETEVEVEGQTYFGYRFYPHKVQGEGFFITVLRRPDDAYVLPVKKQKDFKHPFLSRSGQKEKVKELLGLENEFEFYELKGSLFLMDSWYAPHFEQLTKSLNVKYFGVELGKVSGEQFLPTHEFALSLIEKKGFSKLELTREQALSYLRKEDFELPTSEEGWHLVTFETLPLGWIKNIGNRVNNYYPKDWRIRMK
ncbi:tRNA/rRNA cytosine-C5-methylase [Litoribacter alkaliphilus]|uniref:tRNA/rRNA cytosine-C5-methylase n=1 Tax=Litoribacter ruber TaxID=702568 RepID=A0AAP2CIG3_9BACT|nr:RsmB/NOP family class I SAM-dependent RNA methyltransferase [Litoribacter alkaliphilus]MBS9525343.1 tRNA/rRNA cytosine-C5-methylase [Litoribacter alkaliphilus]